MHRHAICHIEFSSTDLERTRRFLAGMFNWKFDSWGGNYMLFKPPVGVGGGVQRVDVVNPGASPVVFVEVESIAPYLKKAVELGGAVAQAEAEVPHTGWLAQVRDPDGNLIGLFRPHAEPAHPQAI
ncbi:hypothetical protein LLH00_10725 [bacterium]|nr:hypothetical protein [bacterium]